MPGHWTHLPWDRLCLLSWHGKITVSICSEDIQCYQHKNNKLKQGSVVKLPASSWVPERSAVSCALMAVSRGEGIVTPILFNSNMPIMLAYILRSSSMLNSASPMAAFRRSSDSAAKSRISAVTQVWSWCYLASPMIWWIRKTQRQWRRADRPEAFFWCRYRSTMSW